MIGFLIGFLTFLEIFTALLLAGIILIQESKAGGGLGAVGGGITETVFGATAGNVLTKTTVILATVFLLNTLALDIITGHTSHGKSVVETLKPETPASAKAKTPEAKAKAKTETTAAKSTGTETAAPASGQKKK